MPGHEASQKTSVLQQGTAQHKLSLTIDLLSEGQPDGLGVDLLLLLHSLAALGLNQLELACIHHALHQGVDKLWGHGGA